MTRLIRYLKEIREGGQLLMPGKKGITVRAITSIVWGAVDVGAVVHCRSTN
jgi:hypothetical protein